MELEAHFHTSRERRVVKFQPLGLLTCWYIPDHDPLNAVAGIDVLQEERLRCLRRTNDFARRFVLPVADVRVLRTRIQKCSLIAGVLDCHVSDAELALGLGRKKAPADLRLATLEVVDREGELTIGDTIGDPWPVAPTGTTATGITGTATTDTATTVTSFGCRVCRGIAAVAGI